MARRHHLRRGAIAALIITGLLPATKAAATPIDEVPARACDYEWSQGVWQIRQLIRCAAVRWDSPGSPQDAIAVARCESELRPDAYNTNGYAGLFQQAVTFWPDRANRWGQPHRSVYNGRANVIVSVRMAAAAGSWSAWAGCG